MSKAATCGGAAALAAALMVSCAYAADTVTLAAAADDTQSIVLRGEHDALHRYAAGERLPGATWRLSRVQAGTAYFQSLHPVAGKSLTLAVHDGEQFDLSPPPVDDKVAAIPLSTSVRKQAHAQGKHP